ncbi:MAG: hypothetical protein CFK48_02520 [Armatimonadetes bacterium CP1_7O]|nr:MAG: hypothetical protein CFK48_02520 [Armatimonadetes bacterium CP1_7O]
MRRWVFCLGIGGALLLAMWGQSPVEMRVQPLLGTTPAANGAFPLAVQLESKSGNYQGMLSVIVGGFGSRREYLYPIDLPAGSRKVVITTPIVGLYGDQATLRFTARGVTIETQQKISQVLQGDQLAVLVGDSIGGLQVLQQTQTVENPFEVDYSTNRPVRGHYRVAYCRPELFPEQAIALSGAQMIVLGSGAERLRAEQWNALRRWVMLGGVLIAPGGAGAVYLQNPALQALLPVRVQGAAPVSQLRALGNWTGQPAPEGAATLTKATLTTGATLLQQDGLPLIAVRPYGLGAVVFLAFNPLDQPMRDYNARRLFWQRLINQTLSFAPSFTIASIHQYQGGYTQDPWSGQPRLSTNVEIKPPSTALIVVILGVYFLMVVPVNYWTLKRLRALDWAWVVTPLIALVFVGVLWQLAGELYRKSLSSKVQTTIIAQAGGPDAYAVNSVLFFFPRAGRFDLQFDQSDMVEAGLAQPFGASVDSTPSVRTVQGEPTQVEGYRVSNLSFQWFRYTRTAQLRGQVDGVLRIERRRGKLYLAGELHNQLPYDLNAVRILTPFGEAAIGDLPARRAKTISSIALQPFRTNPFAFTRLRWEAPALSPDALASFLLQRREFKECAVLTAQASEPVMPPEVNDAAEKTAEVNYLISFPLKGVR